MRRKCFFLSVMLLCFCCGCGKETGSSTERMETGSLTVMESVEPEQKKEPEASAEPVEQSVEAEPEEGIKDIIPEEFACAVTITINPQITLYLDQQGTVIGVRYDNEDAKEAYSELNLMGTKLSESVPLLVDTAVEKEYLREEGNIIVTLADVGDEEAVTDDSILQTVKEIVQVHLEKLNLTDSQEDGEKGFVNVNLEVAPDVTKDYGIEKTKEVCTRCGGTGIFCPGDPDFGKARGNGNGYAGCNGTGYSPCPDINCHGGNYTDPNCGGSGKQNCFGCKGTGLEDGNSCKHCGGTGKITCEYCGGKGSYPHHEFCMGTGTCECITEDLHITCEACGGSGIIEN